MSWVLIGQPGSKRTAYFLKAAEELKRSVKFVDLIHCKPELLAGYTVKVDPPVYDSCSVDKQPILTAQYSCFLKRLSAAADVCFLNHPDDILVSLNKKQSKQLILNQGIPTTPVLSFSISSYDELVCEMKKNRIHQVFIKPNTGSGATGVVAFRLNPRNDEAVAYTSVLVNNTELLNTKRIRRITSYSESKNIIDKVLQQDAIVERWIQKPIHENVSYDLRVVWQFGKVSFILPRFSKSPITNLHLNNMAGLFDDLRLSSSTISQIKQLCDDTMMLFPGLSYAGIDILLAKDSLRPMVIEVNGQGDLIYQDIYAGNTIYKQQLLDGESLSKSC